ncbi:MAG: PTS sugar transporter subunit IIA [Erysipelotrichaceae bacterium]|nr:PTS sugar transporter subunit IIA [Erysipelotrichaceae bacterium]
MALSELIKNGLVLDFECDNQETFFNTLYETLKDEYVNEDFLSAIKIREYEFPTGLMTRSMAVAVPHVESEYVYKNALILCRFKKPVDFRRMDDFDSFIGVELAFVLLITDPTVHIKTLQDLTKIWQNDEILKELTTSTKEEIVEIVKGIES